MPKRKELVEALVAKLLDLSPPTRARLGYQQFMHESYETVIKPKVEEEWSKKVIAEKLSPWSKPTPSFKTNIAKQMFKALSKSEQDEIAYNAKRDATLAKATWDTVMDGPPTNDPHAIARAIKNIPEILNDIMMAIHETTKMTIAVVYAGPDPIQRGKQIVSCALYPQDLQKPQLPPLHISNYSPKNFRRLLRHINQCSKENEDQTLEAPEMPENTEESSEILIADRAEQATSIVSIVEQPGEPEFGIGGEDDEVVEITAEEARIKAPSQLSSSSLAPHLPGGHVESRTKEADPPLREPAPSKPPAMESSEVLSSKPSKHQDKEREGTSFKTPLPLNASTAMSEKNLLATQRQGQAETVRAASASEQVKGSSNRVHGAPNIRSSASPLPRASSSKKRKRPEDTGSETVTATTTPGARLIHSDALPQASGSGSTTNTFTLRPASFDPPPEQEPTPPPPPEKKKKSTGTSDPNQPKISVQRYKDPLTGKWKRLISETRNGHTAYYYP